MTGCGGHDETGGTGTYINDTIGEMDSEYGQLPWCGAVRKDHLETYCLLLYQPWVGHVKNYEKFGSSGMSGWRKLFFLELARFNNVLLKIVL